MLAIVAVVLGLLPRCDPKVWLWYGSPDYDDFSNVFDHPSIFSYYLTLTVLLRSVLLCTNVVHHYED